MWVDKGIAKINRKNKNMITMQKNKNIIITTVFILFCLGVYTFFPVTGNFQQIITALVFFILLPILYNKIVLRKNMSFYRLQIGDWKKGLFWAILSIIVSFIFLSVLIKYGNFFQKYVLPVGIESDFGQFVFYELVLVAFFTAIYEFFFRGFVLFHFVPIVGRWAVLVQFALFFLFLTATVGLKWEFAPYLIFAPLAGWIAYKSESLLYSFFGQLIFIIIIDASVIKMFS
jgi:membrane protease YdiL (CAAX protease family)